MRLPWTRSKPNRRSGAVGYTASLTAALEAGASGAASDTAPLATAALEAAASLYARCLAAATVKAQPALRDALTPGVLSLIARNLIRRGEDHHLIEVRDGNLHLSPVGFAYATGGPDPMAWRYSITRYGPTDSVHSWVRAAQLVHCRYAVDSSRPWLGVPPWSWSGTTSGAIAALDALVRDKAKAPHGAILGVPESPEIDKGEDGEDGEIRPLDAFRQDLAKAKGGSLLAEHSAKWLDDQPGQPGRSMIEHVPFGFPIAEADALRTAVGRDVLAACGVPPSLFVANSDGTAQREAFRRFLHSSLRPLARIMEAELTLKLDAAVALDLSEINAADVAGRARAFKQLTEAGLDPADAAANTGVVVTRPLRTEGDGDE
ncbi:MAG: hypothetical protein OXH79_03105 [Boseongicola sp.]|nr:hypothetical protein [Boseongicola sp.]